MPEGDGPEVSGTALRAFVGLFLVPLGVVAACVGVFLLFGWLAGRSAGIDAWIDDLDASWRPRRAQAAFELSRAVTADPALLASVERRRALRDRFGAANDPRQRGFLALVLGRAGDPEAVPLLLAALPAAAGEERVYLLLALGLSGDPRALPVLVEHLEATDPGLRKSAAWAIGELAAGGDASEPSIAPLCRRLDDPVADVRWNAAVALARLGSDAGAATLAEVLDRTRTGEVPGITAEQQEAAMLAAIPALAAVAPERARPLLADLARGDPSPEVRRAARRVQGAL